MPKTQIGLIQMAMSRDTRENLQKALGMTREAARQGARLVCLPELFRSRYFCQTEEPEIFELAEPIPGPSCDALGNLAKENHIIIVASLFEKRAAGLYHNTTVVLDADGSIAGRYRKMHIPDDPGYYEKYYFTPGDLGFQAINTSQGKIGTLVCWDQWYPEAARLTALQGAPVLFYPTAIGWHPHEKSEFGAAQKNAWITIQRSHAIANGVFVAAVNRVGLEIPPAGGAGIEFWGQSFISDPFGNFIAQAGDDEEIVLAEVDFDQIESVRRHWPFLRDRRIDAYGQLTLRYLDE